MQIQTASLVFLISLFPVQHVGKEAAHAQRVQPHSPPTGTGIIRFPPIKNEQLAVESVRVKNKLICMSEI